MTSSLPCAHHQYLLKSVSRSFLCRIYIYIYIYIYADVRVHCGNVVCTSVGRGHWHILAHTYVNDPYPAQSISGHGYSRDGLHWTFSRTEPYTGAVQRADGTVKNYATMERPKLLFADPNDPTRPTHLLNGASPVWDADGKNACGACETAACVKCKVSPGMDWTYTVVRPLSL